MADITYSQMQALLESLVRNLDNSETSRQSRRKLDDIISSLDKVRSQLVTNNNILKSSGGSSIDYNRLSSTIIASINTSRSNNTANKPSRRTSGTNRPSSGLSSNNRRPNTLLGQLSRSTNGLIQKNNQVASSSTLLSSKFGNLGGAVTGVHGAMKGLLSIGGLAKVFSAATSAISDRTDSYRTMMANGMTFNGDILEMSRTAASAQMSLRNFTTAIANSSMGLKLLGPQVFAQTMLNIRRSSVSFGDLGLTTTQTAQQLSSYMELLRRTGHLQGQTASSVANGFRTVIQSSTSLAAAVGTSRDAILKASDAITSNTNNRALLHLIGGQGGQNVTQFMSQMVASLGDSPLVTKAVNAMFKYSQGQTGGEDVAEARQVLGDSFDIGAHYMKQFASTSTAVSPEELARGYETFLNRAKQITGSQNVRAELVQGEWGQNRLELGNAIRDAGVNPTAAGRTQADQNQNQRPITRGALGLEGTREALIAAKEATSTAALTSIQKTLGRSLTAWNQAVVEGTSSYTDSIAKLSKNPLISGIDSVGGSVISALTGLVGPIGLFTSVMAGLGAIKILGAVKSFKNSIDLVRGGLDAFGSGGDTLLGRSRPAGSRSQEINNRLRSPRRGILGQLGAQGENLAESAINDIQPGFQGAPRNRGGLSGLRRAARLKKLQALRQARGLTGMARATKLLGARGLGIGGSLLGIGEAGAGLLGAIAAPAAVGVAGIGLGAWNNQRSTNDFKAGKISAAQNNINHDSNYGLMGGAAAGAATGALIGTAVPIIGNIIGAAVGGLVGGGMGYLAGHTIGTWSNPTTEPTATPNTPTSTQADNPATAPIQTNVLLQQLSTLLSTQITATQELHNDVSRILNNIDRNTGDTVRQIRRGGNVV